MNTAQPDPSRSVFVAADADNALVRIQGRATFATGPTFKQLGLMLIDRSCRRLVLDLAGCDGVDSTFLGVLAGLALRMKKQRDSTITMINLSPSIYESVCTLGLDRIIDCHEKGKSPAALHEKLGKLGALSRVEGSKVDADTARATAIEAHEALISSDERNAPRFKDVLTFLREGSNIGK